MLSTRSSHPRTERSALATRPGTEVSGTIRRLWARLVDLLLMVAVPPAVAGIGLVGAEAAGLPRLVVLVPALVLTAGWVLPGWPLIERAALARWGRTPGKALLGLEVRSADGSPIAPSEASVRSVVVIVPVALLPGLGYMAGLGRLSLALPVVFAAALALDSLRDATRRTLADRAAGTVVVRCRTAPAAVAPPRHAQPADSPLLPA